MPDLEFLGVAYELDLNDKPAVCLAPRKVTLLLFLPSLGPFGPIACGR